MRKQLEMKNASQIFAVVSAISLASHATAHAEVSVTTVGAPTFDVVDLHLYTAPTDGPSFQALYPEHFPTRAPHIGYDHELADGLAITGYPEKEVFTIADFTDPNAIHLGYLVAAKSDAPTGTSLDPDGPIISNSLFPITANGDVFLNGELFEASTGAFVNSSPGLDGFDGRSHFIFGHWDNNTFARPDLDSMVGDYEYRIAVRDANSNGYDISARFSIVPEPGALVHLGLATALIFAMQVRARRKTVD